MVRQDDEATPYMRRSPHFISSFQDFVRCDVCDELQRQEQDVDNTVVGSGFTITNIIFLEIHRKSDTLQASSYIDLPKEIKLKKAVVNIQNKDNKCFLCSVLVCPIYSDFQLQLSSLCTPHQCLGLFPSSSSLMRSSLPTL